MKFIQGPRARCHPDRPEYARKLCAECYQRTWNSQDPRTPKCPLHPDRPIWKRGLCVECVQNEWHC
jgi:hypothetical protein